MRQKSHTLTLSTLSTLSTPPADMMRQRVSTPLPGIRQPSTTRHGITLHYHTETASPTLRTRNRKSHVSFLRSEEPPPRDLKPSSTSHLGGQGHPADGAVGRNRGCLNPFLAGTGALKPSSWHPAHLGVIPIYDTVINTQVTLNWWFGLVPWIRI